MKRRLTGLAAVLAVVAAGSAAASAAPIATGPHWIVQSTPNRPVPNNMFAGVSCTSGTFCMAVGISGPRILASPASGTSRPFAVNGHRLAASALSITPLAERWDGTRWRIQPTPNPAGSGDTFLFGVACSSRRACVAVGSAAIGKVTVPVAERWNGSRWSIQKTPRPPRSGFSELVGVSCPTSNECIAVGFESTTSSVEYGFAERWNGSRWTVAGLVRPGATVFFNSVSCSSATRCTAVGAYAIKNTLLPLAEQWTAGRWRKQSTPGTGTLDGVSCPAFSDCTAVGTHPKKGQPSQSAFLAMQWNGRKWMTHPAPEPTGSPSEGILQGVSCPTVTSCEAAGWVDLAGTVAVAEHWNGTSWTLELTPALTGTLGPSLEGIWCGAHVECRAAGFVTMSSGDVKTLVEQRLTGAFAR